MGSGQSQPWANGEEGSLSSELLFPFPSSVLWTLRTPQEQAHHVSGCSVIPNYWLRAVKGLCESGFLNCTLGLNWSFWVGEHPVNGCPLPPPPPTPHQGGVLPLPSGLRAQALLLACRWALGKVMSCSALIPTSVKWWWPCHILGCLREFSERFSHPRESRVLRGCHIFKWKEESMDLESLIGQAWVEVSSFLKWER